MHPEPDEEPATQSSAGILRTLLPYVALGFGNRAVIFLMLPIYLQRFEPDEFAIFMLVSIVAALIGSIANLKLDAAMRTFYFDYVLKPRALAEYLLHVMTATLTSSIVALIATLIFGPVLFSAIFRHAEIHFFPAGAIACATACTQAAIAPYLVYLRNSCNLSKYACLQLAVNLGNACLQLVFIVVLGLGLIGALAGAMIPALLLLIYILAHELSFKFKAPDWKVLKPSLRYAAPLLIFSIFYTLEERLDRLVMEHFLSLDILGPYGVLVAVLGIFPIFLNTLDNAVRPHLFTYLSRNSYKVTGQLQSYSVIYISSSLVALSSILLIGTNLSIFSNEQRYLDIFSWFAFGVLAITPLIVTRYYALFYDYYKRSRELVFWMICRAAITFLLLFTLVPKYGIGGALGALFVSHIATAAIVFRSMRWQVPQVFSLRVIVLPISVFFLVIWNLNEYFGSTGSVKFGLVQFSFVLIAVGMFASFYTRNVVRNADLPEDSW